MNRALALAAVALVVAIIALTWGVAHHPAYDIRRAQGVVTIADFEGVSEKQIGNLVINTAESVVTYEGDLKGTLACNARLVTDISTDPPTTTFGAICNFTGSVFGTQGTLVKLFSLNGDPTAAGTPLQGTSRFFAGSGGLQGMCLAGDFWGGPVDFNYDYVVTSGVGCNNFPALGNGNRS